MKKESSNIKSAKQLAEHCKTPKKVVAWVHRNIYYRKDRDVYNEADFWQDSCETLRIRTGDCEDFSVLISDALSEIGIASLIVGIVNDTGEAHAVCLYRIDGIWYASSNWETLRCKKAQSLRETFQYIYSDWIKANIHKASNTSFGKNKPVQCIYRNIRLGGKYG